MWKKTWLNSYVELSAAAAEPDFSSSITEEGKQPEPFSICANVIEKDRSQELTAAVVEEAKKRKNLQNGWTFCASRWLLLHKEAFIKGSSEPKIKYNCENHNETLNEIV